jgi:hypothetical protein
MAARCDAWLGVDVDRPWLPADVARFLHEDESVVAEELAQDQQLKEHFGNRDRSAEGVLVLTTLKFLFYRPNRGVGHAYPYRLLSEVSVNKGVASGMVRVKGADGIVGVWLVRKRFIDQAKAVWTTAQQFMAQVTVPVERANGTLQPNGFGLCERCGSSFMPNLTWCTGCGREVVLGG